MHETDTTISPTPSPYTIPAAILIAGLLIAGAIMYSGDSTKPAPTAANPGTGEPVGEMAPVTGEDHIIGSANAKVVLVEYSDLECPFCKQFHTTLLDVVEQYGDDEVAWVYRHFPLEQLHAKAHAAAEASECAAELGGNEAFWTFITRYFEITPSNDGIDLAQLPALAEEAGIDRAAFTECVDSGRHAAKVVAQYEDALRAGGTGTPYTIAITKDGKKVAISGAQPATQVKQTVDRLLADQ